MSRITQPLVDQGAYPQRIEHDAMFVGWTKALPRLWYMDQRQATRLDAETLFGAAQFAAFYSRSVFTTLAAPSHEGAIGVRGYLRGEDTDIGQPSQTSSREVEFIRGAGTVVPAINQTSIVITPSGGPVGPIVHPVLGASAGDGRPPIEGTTYFTVTATIEDLEVGDVAFWTVDQDVRIVGVRVRRTGGTDISLNLRVESEYVLGMDLTAPMDGVWLASPASEIIMDGDLAEDDEIVVEVVGISGAPSQVEVEVEFEQL